MNGPSGHSSGSPSDQQVKTHRANEFSKLLKSHPAAPRLFDERQPSSDILANENKPWRYLAGYFPTRK
jgi:hypothetical protein